MVSVARRIVFFADRIAHWNAGTERQLLLLGTELAKRGWEVPLYVLKRSASVVDCDWPGAVEVLDCKRIASPLSWWRLFRVALKEKAKGARLTHCFFNDSAIIVPPVFWLTGLKSIVSRRDMGFWYTSGNLRALRFVRRFVAVVVANCQAVAESVCRSEGFESQSVAVIFNGLVTSKLPPRATNKDQLVVGMVANIRKLKRIDDAIRAFALVTEQFPNARLRIVGDGDVTELEKLVVSLGIEGKVEFPGQTDDPAAEIATFSVAMLTSESEGLSNAIIEYMQAGVPVICTDTGGNPELITHNESGFLAEVGDIDALSDCLGQLLSDANIRHQMGETARQSIRELCSTEKMIEAHLQVYRKVMA